MTISDLADGVALRYTLFDVGSRPELNCSEYVMRMRLLRKARRCGSTFLGADVEAPVDPRL